MTNLRMGLKRAPLSAILTNQVGWALGCAGRYEEAANVLHELVDRESDYGPALLSLGSAQLCLGRTDEAVEFYERAVRATNRGAYSLATLAYAYASSGRATEAERLLEDLEDRGASWMPAVYAALGQTDEAVAQLERAYAERRGDLRFYRCLPQAAFADLTEVEGLRRHPGFQDLLHRIDFPGT